MKIIKKMTDNFQASGSSGHNDSNFSNFNEYEDENYGDDIPINILVFILYFYHLINIILLYSFY